MPKPPHDKAASVRARLLNAARKQNVQLQLLLTRFVLERLLYRLSLSRHRDRFALKGAMLIATWIGDSYRSTRDADLLAFGSFEAPSLLDMFREICAIPVEDGVQFDIETLTIDRIREETKYGGVRIKSKAIVAGARVTAVTDIGFGDSVEPGIEEIELPVLLDLPAPILRAYARETVIAEKFQAMMNFGYANTRLKDYYDIWILSHASDFAGDRLARAIAATFLRRETEIPTETPDALSRTFTEDKMRLRQWAGFANNIAKELPPLPDVVGDLVKFLMPHADKARRLGTTKDAK